MAWRHVTRLRKHTQPVQQIVLLADSGKLLALYALLLTAGLVVNCK
jgi:1,4-dihydroxy-2-naphthoate octaprenyltransferase